MEGTCGVEAELDDIPQLLRKAEQALKPPGFFGQLLGREPDYDLAIQLLQQCGQKYKLARRFPEARDCFLKAAEAAHKADDSHAEASLFTEAGNCARRISLSEGAAVSRRAVSVLIRAGRLAAAGKILKTLAEEFEASQEKGTAAQLYAEAARLFETDEYSSSQRSACICKYAELLASGAAEDGLSQKARLEKAAKLLEEEGFKASQNSLLQFGAKDVFFKALLARMAAASSSEDLVDLQLCLTRFSERNAHFSSSREARLLRQLLEAVGERDEAAFTQAVQTYDNITRLDPWKVNLLLKIKPTLLGGGAGGHVLSAAGLPAEEAVLDGDGEVDLT